MSERIRKQVLAAIVALTQVLVPLGLASRVGADEGMRIVVNEVDASEYPRIRVVAAVNDASGKPVRGLTAAQLLVSENGAPQNAVVELASEVAPVALALVLDTSGSMAGRPLADAKAAMAFLAVALATGTWPRS
jgi:hypothetical protein